MESIRFCRICLKADADENFVHEACACKGSIDSVHDKCLKRWRVLKDDFFRCELCNAQYSAPYERGMCCQNKTTAWVISVMVFYVIMWMTISVILAGSIVGLTLSLDEKQLDGISNKALGLRLLYVSLGCFAVCYLIHFFVALLEIFACHHRHSDAQRLAYEEAITWLQSCHCILRIPAILPTCVYYYFRSQYLRMFKYWTIQSFQFPLTVIVPHDRIRLPAMHSHDNMRGSTSSSSLHDITVDNTTQARLRKLRLVSRTTSGLSLASTEDVFYTIDVREPSDEADP